jgi:hypothetical protein
VYVFVVVRVIVAVVCVGAGLCLPACSLTYSECNAQASYCHLWPLWLDHIFRHYLINGTIFEKKVAEHKMSVLIFSTTLLEIFLILRRIQRDIVISVKTSSCKVPVILVGF